MKEELIVSGRLNPHIDPVLQIWGWEIPLYLFLGGLSAGILFFAAYYYIVGKENEYKATIKIAPLLTPILLSLGLFALFLDLKHKMFFWQLYTTLKIQSPMSWGAWTLMVVSPIAFIWSATYIKDVFPKFNWKYNWLNNLETFFKKQRKIMAWILIFFSVILGIYTGILLSAFNARPLWNTSILGPLFLVSGLSAAAATIMLFSKNLEEKKLFGKIDLILIGIELFLIVHLFMGFMASNQAQIEAAQLFLGGAYTLPFWIIVVFIGMILPAIVELLEIKGYHIPAYIPFIMVIVGNIAFRFIMVYAGQISRYLY